MVSPNFREYYILVTLGLHRLATGYVLAYPAVLTAALTSKDCATDLCGTKDEASWIAASYTITGTLSFLILPHLMQAYGRRFMNVFMNIIIIVGSLFIANASNIAMLIAARAIQGLALCGLFLNCMIAAEYSHPKKRGFSVTLMGSTTCIGILLSHGLGFVLTWRQTAYVGALPSVIGALSTLAWLESPSWLAYQGRYEDCAAVFDLLRENNEETKKELTELITAQKEIRKIRMNQRNFITYILCTLRSKDFLKPLAVMSVLIILVQVCGLYYLLAYVIEIMVQLTGNSTESVYFTIGLDAFKVISFFFSCVLMKLYNRRTILFIAGAIACFLIASLCIFDFLEGQEILHIKLLTPIILILFNTVVHIGVIPVYLIMLGEIYPLEYKSIGMTCVGIIYSSTGFMTLKFTATMLEVLNIYGTFTIYLLIAVASLVVLYYILPETKDRTLQNIEFDFIDMQCVIDQDCSDVLVERSCVP